MKPYSKEVLKHIQSYWILQDGDYGYKTSRNKSFKRRYRKKDRQLSKKNIMEVIRQDEEPILKIGKG